jgi:hypothetical protein
MIAPQVAQLPVDVLYETPQEFRLLDCQELSHTSLPLRNNLSQRQSLCPKSGTKICLRFVSGFSTQIQPILVALCASCEHLRSAFGYQPRLPTLVNILI